MKKFLSIKNTQGIYVARASFSSDETVIDFVNSKYSENSITNPVSVVVAPNQQISTLTTSNHLTACDSISVQSQSVIAAKSSGKKKFKARLLKFLHIKKKAKMGDDATLRSSDELPSTSGSYPMLHPTPKMSRAKGRTAALVKKFTLTPKTSSAPPPPPQEMNRKKSLIPLRTAASVETLSNAPQSGAPNDRIKTTATVSHHSMSEMNLVNIDYRQERSAGDNFDAGDKVDQTPYETNWSSKSKNSSKSIKSANSSNINSKMVSDRKSTSTEKLQITISGKKRTTNNNMDIVTKSIQQRSSSSKHPLTDIEPKKIERKALTMQQPSKKLNISHDLTLMNTIGVPPAPTTQAPLAIPTAAAAYRTATTTTASIKKFVQSHTAIKAQSTMQSQQSVETSASAVNVEQNKNTPKRADTLVTVTSFDVEEPDDLVAASECKLSSEGKANTSLLTEIIEAERRNSITMDAKRGHRYPSAAAASETTTEFSHQPSTSTDLIAHEANQLKSDIIPKVIIEEVISLASENAEKFGKNEKSENPTEKTFELDIDKDNELMTPAVKAQASDNTVAQEVNDDNELSTAAAASSSSSSSQPTLQFERRNMSSSPEKREHLYKILVIGELGTGKTSFIKRYVHQFFSQNYRATIGVDFALKVLNWDQNTIIRLQLWDIAGQERFGNMTRVYYKEAVGAFIVFDVTRSATFDAVIKWKQDLDSKVQLQNGSPIPCILIANKCDQPKQGIVNTPAKMDDYVKEHGFAGWFETSAKENINIEEAARALVNKILLNDKIINAGEILDADKFNLNGSSSERPKKTCSC